MNHGILTLDDVELKGKRVLCRVDINCPIDRESGTLKDTTRIDRCLDTLRELSEKGARVAIISHQGGDLEYHNFYSTRPHAEYISERIGKKVEFVDDYCGPTARQRIEGLKDGELLMLENVRIMAEEMTLFETKLQLTPQQQALTYPVRKLSPIIDLFVCDAFATAHRAQPSTVGFPELVPSVMGRLFEKEFCTLTKVLEEPKRPCVFLLGGTKVEDAFLMMQSVLDNGTADLILTGGLVSQIFLLAKGTPIGKASEQLLHKKKLMDLVDTAKAILAGHEDKVMLPIDFNYGEDSRRVVGIDDLLDDEMITDIGDATVDDYEEHINKAATIFINGPVGIFEKEGSSLSTKRLWECITKSNAFSVIGGGDSITAANKFGVTSGFSYVCTAGGGLVRFMSGETLPTVKALRDSAKRFKKK